MAMADESGPAEYAVPDALLLEYIEDRSTFTLLDARGDDEYEKSHLDGAISMPRDHIDELLSALPAEKNKLIVTYCRTGSRANLLKLELRDRGYTDVRILEPEQILWHDDRMSFNVGSRSEVNSSADISNYISGQEKPTE